MGEGGFGMNVTVSPEVAKQMMEHLEGGPGHRRGPWVLVDMEGWVSVCECGIKTVVSNETLRETAFAPKVDDEPLTFSFFEEESE
jgi:hypothetical protein